MSFSNVIPEINNISMLPDLLENIRNCEHCSKKNVCKYKERMEEVMTHFDNLLNDNDEQLVGLPLVVTVDCKEFSVGYTGVRYHENY